MNKEHIQYQYLGGSKHKHLFRASYEISLKAFKKLELAEVKKHLLEYLENMTRAKEVFKDDPNFNWRSFYAVAEGVIAAGFEELKVRKPDEKWFKTFINQLKQIDEPTH